MHASLTSLLAGIRQTKLAFPPMSTAGYYPGSFRLALEKIITADRQDELPTEVSCRLVPGHHEAMEATLGLWKAEP